MGWYLMRRREIERLPIGAEGTYKRVKFKVVKDELCGSSKCIFWDNVNYVQPKCVCSSRSRFDKESVVYERM
jgi:hypothetical protein